MATEKISSPGRRAPTPCIHLSLGIGAAPSRAYPGAWRVPQSAYRPRDAEHAVLHAVIAEHLEVFLREAASRTDGLGLPRFVEDEFRAFLRCGVLAHGFARLRCDGCWLYRLLPFSAAAARVSPPTGRARPGSRS